MLKARNLVLMLSVLAAGSANATPIDFGMSPSELFGADAHQDIYGAIANRARFLCGNLTKGSVRINWVEIKIQAGGPGVGVCGNMSLDPSLDATGNNAHLLCYPQIEIKGDITCPSIP